MLAGFSGFFDLRGLALTALRGATGLVTAGRRASLCFLRLGPELRPARRREQRLVANHAGRDAGDVGNTARIVDGAC